MSGQEIDRSAVWGRLDSLLVHEAALPRAADLAVAMQLATERVEDGFIEGGEKAVSRLAGEVASLLRTVQADLDALRSEFARKQ